MNDPAARRFVCLDCGWIHLTWSARCSSCLSLKGLAAAAANDAPGPVAPSVSSVEAAPQELSPEPSRPRLMIARAPSPDPELTAPTEELADVLPPSDGPIPITEIAQTPLPFDSTGLAPLDHVLGGGLFVGSVVLLASPRGIGKTSLTLQMLKGLGHRCLYVTGEETLEQLAGTARRIGALTPRLHVLVERHLAKIFAHARAMRAQTIAIDSIQKMKCDEVGGRAGSPGQLKECTAQLVDFAKSNSAALWLIGHMTGDGNVAGPETIEHDVDVVLELTAGVKFNGNERILKCLGKNRFGPSNLTGSFELTAEGLVPVDADGWDEGL